LFRLSIKKSLEAFGVPKLGKWLKYVSIFVAFCSLLAGALSFIPFIQRAQCNPNEWFTCIHIYIFAAYCM
jgi:hypothetical protein